MKAITKLEEQNCFLVFQGWPTSAQNLSMLVSKLKGLHAIVA